MLWRPSATCLLVFISMGAFAQVEERPTAEYPVTLHQRVNDSCELIQRGTMLQYKDYVAIRLIDVAEELYSPELGIGDVVAATESVPKKEVKSARRSGFEVRTEPGDNVAVPEVVAVGASSCPVLQDAVKEIAQQRTERVRQLQSHLYSIGGDVIPAVLLKQEQPSPNADSTANKQTELKPKVKSGTAILKIAIAVDGSVHPLKVVRSVDPALDAKAIEVVQRWRFSPARKNGLPVPVQTYVEVNFHLD
jgi:TonB family protein